jgi:hypothetical protein
MNSAASDGVATHGVIADRQLPIEKLQQNHDYLC